MKDMKDFCRKALQPPNKLQLGCASILQAYTGIVGSYRG